jgi:hypothetical protein
VSRRRRPVALALTAVLAAQVLVGAHYVSRTAIREGDARVFVLWDDAMISMRYARHLALGYGLVWNPGEEPVQGYTNLGLTLVMAGLHYAGLSREIAALPVQLLALAALAATAALGARMVRDLSGNAWVGVGVAIAMLLCAPVQIYALQGSDTGFVAVLLAAAHGRLIHGWMREHRWPREAFAALLAAVVVRPDATLFVAAALAVMLLYPDERGRRASILPALGLVALWGGLILFSLTLYGDPLPNTWYLKATGAAPTAMWASGVDQLAAVALGLTPAVALALLGLLGRPSARGAAPTAGPPLALLALTVAVAVAYHVQVGGDWIRAYGSRHLVQVLPTLFVLAGVGAARLAALTPPPVAGAVGLVLAAAIGPAASPPLPAREWYRPSTPTLLHLENQMNFLRSRFLERATYPGTSIAVHWAGVGPYFADRPAVDVLGRADRHIAHGDAKTFVPGHSKWDWDYVLETRRPHLIDFASRGLEQHPAFQRDYLVLRVGPASDLFIRRDAVARIRSEDVEILPLEAHFGPASPPAP